jgi:hypothetical protein
MYSRAICARRGSAPEGYECPVDLGYCDEPNDIVHGPPVPIEEEPVPDPDPPIG